jgi:hypothetical protein
VTWCAFVGFISAIKPTISPLNLIRPLSVLINHYLYNP